MAEEKMESEKGFFKTVFSFIRSLVLVQPEKKKNKDNFSASSFKMPEQDSKLEDDVFHYQRGSFRKFEQSTYSDLATGVTGPTRGLFKVLFVSKGNRMTFFTVIMCATIVFIVSLLSGKPNESSIAGFNTHLTAFSFDGRVYAQVEFKQGEKEKNDNLICFDVLFEAVNTDNAVSDKKSFAFDLNPSSPQSAVCIFNDYDIKAINCTLRYEDESAILKCSVTGK